MAKLTDAFREQIRNMRKDGKMYQEIRDFFKESYKIKLFDCNIAAIMRGETSGKLPGKHKKAGANKIKMHPASIKAFRKLKSSLVLPIIEESSDEFANHIHAAYDIFRRSFIRKVEEVISG